MRIEGVPGGVYVVTVLDVSKVGLRVSCPVAMPLGTRVKVTCHGADIVGEIRYARDVERDGYYLGVQADQVSRAGQVQDAEIDLTQVFRVHESDNEKYRSIGPLLIHGPVPDPIGRSVWHRRLSGGRRSGHVSRREPAISSPWGCRTRPSGRAGERIKSALLNSGFGYPNKSVTINLAPANVRKEGAGFDLPMALGILGAMGTVAPSDEHLFVGELSLDGAIRPVRGALSIAACARRAEDRESAGARRQRFRGRRGRRFARVRHAAPERGGRVPEQPGAVHAARSRSAARIQSPRRDRRSISAMCAARPLPSALSKSRRRAATTCFWWVRPGRARPCSPNVWRGSCRR